MIWLVTILFPISLNAQNLALGNYKPGTINQIGDTIVPFVDFTQPVAASITADLQIPITSLQNKLAGNSDSIQTSRFEIPRPLFSPIEITLSSVGMGYGLMGLFHSPVRNLNEDIHNGLERNNSFIHTGVDDYLKWSPAVAVLGLNIAGIKGRNSLKNELLIYGISTIVNSAATVGIKHLSHEQRPNHGDYLSFPSGHTSVAFAAAEFLRMEYKDHSPWIGIAGYTAATATGVMRIYKNRHWLSDVVAGAAVGFVSTRLSYAIAPWIKEKIFHSNKSKIQTRL